MVLPLTTAHENGGVLSRLNWEGPEWLIIGPPPLPLLLQRRGAIFNAEKNLRSSVLTPSPAGILCSAQNDGRAAFESPGSTPYHVYQSLYFVPSKAIPSLLQ